MKPSSSFSITPRGLKAYPRRSGHALKNIAFEVSEANSKLDDAISCSRWEAAALPVRVPLRGDKIAHGIPGYYAYPEYSDHHFHVNFADPHLFGYYESGLLAQDEVQVLEHPNLARLREAMPVMGVDTMIGPRSMPQADSDDGRSRDAVIVIQNVERTVKVGRALYGNAFARTDVEKMLSQIEPLDPTKASNIVAMAAPAYGSGNYSLGEILRILRTASTGFRAVAALDPDAIVHTGYWGCGAFGGNRTVMAGLQVLAAQIANVHLVFHFGEDEASWSAGLDMARSLDQEIVENAVVAFCAFEWGVSSGT